MTQQLPQNLETEQAILGALIAEPERSIKACWDAGLEANDFALDRHRIVFQTISAAVHRGDSMDVRALIDELRRTEVPTERGKTVNALDFVGGSVAVLTLAERMVAVALVKQHATEVVAQALSRELVLAGEELSQHGQQLDDIPEAVTETERRLVAVRDRAEGRTGARRLTDIRDIQQQVLEHYNSPEPDDVVYFPIDGLNALGGGMFPGDVIVVGARSGVGKSWWGLDSAEKVLDAGRRVAIFSIEMPAAQMARRFLAMGGHSLTAIRQRSLPYDRMETRINEIDSWSGRLSVLDLSTNVDRIQSELASARINGKPYRLVVVDHLHLLDVPGSRGDYRISLNEELTRLKHLALEFGVSIILLGQLNRPKKGDEGKRPTIHDLRESGGIGDIADYVLLLHREPGQGGGVSTEGVVIVEKVRDGAGTGDIEVVFDAHLFRFREQMRHGLRGAVA